MPMKLSELIEACFNKTSCTILMSKQLSDAHPVQNDLKHGRCVIVIALLFHFINTVLAVSASLEEIELSGTHKYLCLC